MRVVHRGDLHGVFLKACREHELIELRVSTEVVGYDQDGASVTAQLASGESVTGAALIGADGLWSNVRKQVVGDGPPRVSGHTTYRSVIPTEQMPEDLRWNAATLWAGPKCHIVHYPLSGWKVFNLVVTYHNDAPEPVAGKPVSDEEVHARLCPCHPRAQAIIRHGKDWKLWVLCDRDPIERWVDGRVALLGDAAHPMLQYFAQGACLAMEDAVCLSHMLGAHPGDHARRWKNTAPQRFARTARVQLLSRAIGEHIYHPAGEHARCATPSCAPRRRRIIIAIWPGSMAGRGWRGSWSKLGEPPCAGTQCLEARGLNPHHRLPVDLAGAGLRQFVDERDLARIFVGQQPCLDEILQHLGRAAFVEVVVFITTTAFSVMRRSGSSAANTAHSRTCGMFGQAKLDFERIDPLAGNLDQIVGAAAEEMEAVGVAHETVAGVDPAALADGLGGLVRPVPVQRRVGIAAHPQDALLVVADLAAVLVPERDFIAGHAQPGGAGLLPLRPVGRDRCAALRSSPAPRRSRARSALFQPLNTSAESTSAADSAMPQRGEIRRRAAPSALVSAV